MVHCVLKTSLSWRGAQHTLLLSDTCIVSCEMLSVVLLFLDSTQVILV